MMPTPTPAPPMPMQAMPAPMYFAANGSIYPTPSGSTFPVGPSVARVNRIVEIDAGKNGEHASLQERHQRLEREKNDDHGERQHAAGPAERAHGAAHQDDEAGEHLQRDVAGQHVSEQTYAVRDRPRHEREDLDKDDQRQDVDRHALRNEQIEEVQPVPPQSVDQHGQEHRDCQGGGDDDVAGDRESKRDEPDHVHGQNEHEQREHEGEELHAFRTGGATHRGGDEFVGKLRGRLQARGDQAAAGGADDQKGGNVYHRRGHEGRGIGEDDLGVPDLDDREEVDNPELMDGIGGHWSLVGQISGGRTTPAARIDRKSTRLNSSHLG